MYVGVAHGCICIWVLYADKLYEQFSCIDEDFITIFYCIDDSCCEQTSALFLQVIQRNTPSRSVNAP